MRLYIGNQTAYSAAECMAPYRFALQHGFDSFEWFADKKISPDGIESGWAFDDMCPAMRAAVRDQGRELGIRFTVHSPWQANPLLPDGNEHIIASIDFACDIGASLVNFHLYAEEGAEQYADAVWPVVTYAREKNMRLSLENTPHTGPAETTAIFAALRSRGAGQEVGLCFDMGHANCCEATRNDYIRFLDALADYVPLVHLHVHENFGDADTHMPLFTGPAGRNDGGIRALVQRLQHREYDGCMILEQWPTPPKLLLDADAGIRGIAGLPARQARPEAAPPTLAPLSDAAVLSPQEIEDDAQEPSARESTPSAVDMPDADSVPDAQPIDAPSTATRCEDPLIQAIIEANRSHTSWRTRLGWVRDTLLDEAFLPTQENLAAIAVYLRFLGTGEIACAEDGGHHRPSRHAAMAEEIEEWLAASTTPQTRWLVRRIAPWLPSFDEAFRHAEPLTRIRDIAHRNDIPKDLKLEIKHTLQNKLHRSAGPEDLATSEDILRRIITPGADYNQDFVEQFKIFHAELLDFFNAPSLENRLARIRGDLSQAGQDALDLFLRTREQKSAPHEQLRALTTLRPLLQASVTHPEPILRQRLRMADIELSAYAFPLMSASINSLHDNFSWTQLLTQIQQALCNVSCDAIDAEEATVISADLAAWQDGFDGSKELHLQRVHASLMRARRLCESFADTVMTLFPPRVTAIGEGAGVEQHAIDVFCEGDIRKNNVFQLSKLISLGLRMTRDALQLPLWEVIVPGLRRGRLIRCDSLEAVAQFDEPTVVWLAHAEGDEEIPSAVQGILLMHEIPHLSHLGVRARQAGVPFVTCENADAFPSLGDQVGQLVRYHVAQDDVSMEVSEASTDEQTLAPSQAAISIPQTDMADTPVVVPLEKAQRSTCGAKAYSARLLIDLAKEPDALFQAPRGVVIPFGVMESCLSLAPTLAKSYAALVHALPAPEATDLHAHLKELRDLIHQIPLPQHLLSSVASSFHPAIRLAVRSSANGEDLEAMAGAGLYDSVLNVTMPALADAIRTVWASLWTVRATQSRTQAGIEHDKICMAVLVQEQLRPDLSFIMHTIDPVSEDATVAAVELAVGLGEVLASATEPGAPYRLSCRRSGGAHRLERCASFSFALQASTEDGNMKSRIQYHRVPLSNDATASQTLGRSLAGIATFLEARLDGPQDVEGCVCDENIHVVQTRPQQGLSSVCHDQEKCI